jgi:hypothetical protein
MEQTVAWTLRHGVSLRKLITIEKGGIRHLLDESWPKFYKVITPWSFLAHIPLSGV